MRYPAYPEYKDSGVEWLGEIPEGWKVNRFRFLLRDGYDGLKIGPFGSQIKSEELTNEGYKVYGQENVINRNFNLGFRYLDENKFQELKVYEIVAGDILITMMGTSGKCEITPEGIAQGIMDSHLIRLRLNGQITSDFVKYLIDQSVYVDYQMKQLGKGSIMHGLNSSIIKSLLFILPPLPEQKSIARFLDKKTSQIDALIEKKNELIEKLKEQRMALITKAVTKGLDDTVPMKDSGVDWLGEIPEGWECSSLKWFIRTTSGEFISNTEIDSELSEITPVPIIGGNGIMAYCNKINNEPNSIVVGRVGAYCGNVHFIKEHSWVTDNALLITIIGKEYSLDYLYWYLKSLNLNSFANKNAQPLITGEIVKNQTAVIPSLAEQKSIAEYLDEKTAKIDALIEKVEKAIEKLKEYRITLITDAVTGKIKV